MGEEEKTDFVTGLRCHECGRMYPESPLAGCTECFAPLTPAYDYPSIRRVLGRDRIQSRDESIWRYRELLPIDGPPRIGLSTGGTPLVRAERLGRRLGLDSLFIKDEGVNSPTVAANAAAAGLPAWILVPADLEPARVAASAVYGPRMMAVRGSYDDVNRLATQITDRYGWGFVNVNLRPYYGDGSRTLGYEIAEQLGWKAPDAIVAPMAGGSLIHNIHHGLMEFEQLGLLEAPVHTKMFGAQATGCNPITAAVKGGTPNIRPVKPDTIAKSLAVGSPADGYDAAGLIKDSGGWGEDVADEAIVENVRLLAETEGIFGEAAGGVALGVTRKLVESGRITRGDCTVIVITGNGMKTQEALKLQARATIEANLEAFDEAALALGLTA
jgi:threonine synthase